MKLFTWTAAFYGVAVPFALSAQTPCATVAVTLDSVKFPIANRVVIPIACPPILPAVHDTTVRVDTVTITKVRVDTVFVPRDTATKPDTTTPPVIITPPPIVVPPPVVAPSLVTLPLVWLDTKAPPAPDGGIVLHVARGGNLQAALDSSQPGDVIELDSGAVFTGNFILRTKVASAKWITIRPSNYASLPAEGSRLTPTIAAALVLPRIETANVNNAIAFTAGSNHWRITGVEIGLRAGVPMTYALVNTEANSGQKLLTDVPSFIVLDRVYVHGSATQTVRRCVALNSASSAVIDSWLSDCHELGSDSQAIAIWNGPGPFKICNNYLEAAGENLMIGGNDPSIPGLVPSDIQVCRNHFFKPIAWKGHWTVKNLLETKNAQRVLIEGNVLENSWTSGQNGLGVGFKSSNQNGTCTWCVTQDVTYRLNVLRNVGAAYNIGASPDNKLQTVHANRIVMTDNIATNINTDSLFNGDGRAFLLDGDLREVTIAHNTTVTQTHSFVMGGAPSVSLTVKDNVFASRRYAVLGTGYSGGAAWAFFAPSGVLTGNVFIADPSLSATNFGTLLGYPVGNFFVSGSLNVLAADLSVLTGYAHQGAGADIAKVTAATAGVVIP